MSSDVISIRNFSKSFGKNQVITDLEFDVRQGEIFAFLGANGSGKTTTIRCLLNIYQPDRGELLVMGQHYTPAQANILGYLPEERGLYTTSRVLETLIYFGQIKGLDYETAHTRAAAYLERVGIADKQNSEIKSLSSGQQQKIQLGITILNRPQLLILDEPTKGLDPVNRNLLLEILFELNKEGTTILFSTHQMEEAEKIANRLLMIKAGKRALYGGVEEVKRSFGTNTIEVEFSGQFPTNSSLYAAKVASNIATLTTAQNVTSAEILKYLTTQSLTIKRFEITTPTLNDIFIQVSESDAD